MKREKGCTCVNYKRTEPHEYTCELNINQAMKRKKKDLQSESVGKANEVSFTLGPWYVEHDNSGYYVGRPQGFVCKIYKIIPAAYVGDKVVTEEANARLIAQAPSMYESLKRIEKWGEQHGTAEIQGILNDVYNVIRNAEGK